MKIVFLEKLGIPSEILEKFTEKLEKAGHIVEYYDETENIHELEVRIKDADIINVVNLKLDKKCLEKAKHLKMISVSFSGVDHIDLEYCKKKNIVVKNCPGYSTDSVAELTFGLILGLYRNLVSADARVRTQHTRNGLLGRELVGKTIGVIGTGLIGKRVIELAKAFKCEVIANSRTKKKEITDLGVEYMNLEEIFSKSDIITLHVPLNDETKYMIGEKEIKQMKKDAIIINTARGDLINPIPLTEVLMKKEIAGAGIDVFFKEPPIPEDHSLLYAKHALLSPHIAFFTREALIRRANMTLENIFNFLKR